jgi:hypothetical protein
MPLGLPAHFIRPHPPKGSLPKTCPEFSVAFQTNAKRLFGFFNAHPLNQASLFRGFALKKPPEYSGGFVAFLGNSLDEFAADIKSLLEIRFTNNISSNLSICIQ